MVTSPTMVIATTPIAPTISITLTIITATTLPIGSITALAPTISPTLTIELITTTDIPVTDGATGINGGLG